MAGKIGQERLWATGMIDQVYGVSVGDSRIGQTFSGSGRDWSKFGHGQEFI